MNSRTAAPTRVWLLLLALLAGLVAAVPATAAEPAVQRIAGTERYATAAAISASHFAPGVPVAYVATGASFPDALAGGAAAAKAGGPVLLSQKAALPAATAAELDRLKPARIVVLGGASAVSDEVLAQLKAHTSGAVTRLAGTDRYSTAAAISSASFAPGVRNVYVTTGLGFADALAAGPAAGTQGSPVLLVAPGALPPATAQELSRLDPQAITVLGGATAVWPAVEEALRPYAPVTRVMGPNRYSTSAAVAARAFPAHVPAVYLATGASFPDALAGGPVAALTPGPLMLVPKDCIPAAVQAQIDRLAPDRVVLLGGTGAVGAGVERGTVCPSSGTSEPTGPVSGGPARTFAVESPDYASEVHGDPWDYSNREDIHIGTPQMSHAGSISGGLLSYTTATQYPWMDPIPYLPGSMPLERDGPRAPVDTARYTHVSVRMFVSEKGFGNFVWSTCDWSKDRSCSGAKGVSYAAGWHTYDVELEATDGTLKAPWTGKALQLRFLPHNLQGVTVKVDWMRLHGAAAPVRFTLAPAAPGSTNEVFWDADGSLANNTPDNPAWGRLGTTSGTTYDFPAAAYPPGQYRLYTRASGRTGAYTEALHLLPRPRAIVDSPSLTTGADYATTVRKNPWDFNGMDDVGARRANVCNARILTGGVLAANNCGAEIDNPFFHLPNPGPFSGDTYHRLTLRMRYDGPFGLTGGPTGGAVARLIWYVGSKPGQQQNVHDIVVYPGWQTISVDLKTSPSVAVIDETQRDVKVGWAGQTITSLRLDPNEDVSERRWYIDSVRLTQEDKARGRYNVRFRETSGLGGTAKVFLDRDRGGSDGVAVATHAVTGGSNAVPITLPASLPAGRYWPYVVLTGPSGTSTKYASAPVHLSR